MIEFGIYIIDDTFYNRFSKYDLKDNKSEKRPHCFCFSNTKYKDILWVIPLSTQVSKYQNVMNKRKANHKPCDIIHICKLDNGKLNVFSIQDMFPVTKQYVKRPYTFAGNHLVLTNKTDIEIILSKATRIKNQIERGSIFIPEQVKALEIKQELINDLRNNTNVIAANADQPNKFI